MLDWEDYPIPGVTFGHNSHYLSPFIHRLNDSDQQSSAQVNVFAQKFANQLFVYQFFTKYRKSSIRGRLCIILGPKLHRLVLEVF